jgi:hypothetical protein
MEQELSLIFDLKWGPFPLSVPKPSIMTKGQ